MTKESISLEEWMSNYERLTREEYKERALKAYACHEKAMEEAIHVYFTKLIDLLSEDEEIHIGYLTIGEPHISEGHLEVPNQVVGIPYRFGVEILDPKLVLDIMSERDKKFPKAPLKYFSVKDGPKWTCHEEEPIAVISTELVKDFHKKGDE